MHRKYHNPDAPAWVASFIDIPFKEHGRDRSGCDCWGLYRLAFHERFGMWLPSGIETYARTIDGACIDAVIKTKGIDTADWTEVDLGYEREGDALLMSGFFAHGGRWHKADMHVGFVVAPGVVLHVERGIDASLGHYVHDRRFWNRMRGFYRSALLETK